jgi:acyl-CoA dehydrogenase
MSDAQAEDVSAILLEQTDRLFQQHATPERVQAADRGEWPAAIWDAIAEAGLPMALLSEEQGGYGLPPAHALKLIRRAAYHTAPVPLAETMVATALWAAASGDPPDGVITFGAGALSLAREGTGYRLAGRLARVPWGDRADRVLVFAREAGGAGHLALVPPPPVSGNEARVNLAFEPRPSLSFDAVTVRDDAVRAAPPICAEGLLVFGAAMRAQQMVGAMERCLEHALKHANERKQFGRALAKFQAIQHMLAEAAGHFAAASAAADGAAEAWGHPEFRLATAIAKARVGEAAGKVAAICHQVHGAMGFTQEHPLHFATRRLWSWRDEFGGEATWEAEIGRGVCAQGGEALWDTLVRVAHLSTADGGREA